MPPEVSPRWLMRIAEREIGGWLRREVSKVISMFSMLDMRGPFHSSHFGSGSSIGRCHRVSDDKRCGSFVGGIGSRVCVWCVCQ
jgi:hypothetical protein